MLQGRRQPDLTRTGLMLMIMMIQARVQMGGQEVTSTDNGVCWNRCNSTALERGYVCLLVFAHGEPINTFVSAIAKSRHVIERTNVYEYDLEMWSGTKIENLINFET